MPDDLESNSTRGGSDDDEISLLKGRLELPSSGRRFRVTCVLFGFALVGGVLCAPTVWSQPVHNPKHAVQLPGMGAQTCGHGKNEYLGQEGEWVSCGERDLCLLGLLTETDPLAVCTDGTPAVFYYNPPQSGSSKHFYIYEPGGDWCYDRESCDRQPKRYMTRKGWAAVIKPAVGSFLNYPASVNAHRIYLPYCSSDAYIGNYTKDGMQFRGRVAMAALYEVLHKKYGLGDGHTVVHSGCSAGGRGVMYNTNWLLRQLKAYGDVHFLPVLDSGLYLGEGPVHGETLAFTNMAQQFYRNTPDSIDPDCRRVYGEDQGWKCLIGEFALPTLQTRFVAQAFAFDTYQWEGRLKAEHSTWFGRRHQSLAAQLAKAGNRIFAPAVSGHCSEEGPCFTNFTVNNVSMSHIVDEAVSAGRVTSEIEYCWHPQGYVAAQFVTVVGGSCKEPYDKSKLDHVYGRKDPCGLEGHPGVKFGSGFTCTFSAS